MGVGEKRVQSFLCVFERVKRVFVKNMCKHFCVDVVHVKCVFVNMCVYM
jgi:hypothetical protein